MARTAAGIVSQLVAQAGGVRQYLAFAGVPYAPAPKSARVAQLTPEQRDYRNARRAVERATTARGRQRHATVAPKYAARAERAGRNLRHRREAQAAAPAPPPAPAAGGRPPRIPRAVRITARMRYNTADPRQGRERTVTLPIGGADDWDDWLSDQEEFVNGLMGGALEDYELIAVEYLY